MDHGQCITDETLTEYLEGGLDPAIKAASEVHLIACDDCRGRLVFFMRVLDNDVTGEESGKIKIIANQWNNKKPAEKVPAQSSVLTNRFLTMIAVAAMLIIGIVSVVFVMNRLAEPRSAEEVVQVLLAQHRPFEARMADEPHRPLVRTRGTEEPAIAYGLLAAEMTRLSADSHQMGRFYLLQKDFNRSLLYLEMAEKEIGARAEVHNDLGVAYLESGDPSRIEKAAAEFRHALRMDPRSATAAFNLAMFYERTGAAAQAEAQWKRYLELDSKTQWAEEARSRLQGISR
jgi:cytochrome c-type biogenesis protein CcmH/NrfG